MNHRPISVLKDIQGLRFSIEAEKFRFQYLNNLKVRERRLKRAEEQLKKIDRIEQFCRAHITDEQWKGIIG